MIVLGILFAALLPVGVLAFYIIRKDSLLPEPAGQLLKAFGAGLLTVPASFMISIPLMGLGFYVDAPETVVGGICTAFFGAAIPEEIAKFALLWLVQSGEAHMTSTTSSGSRYFDNST